MSSNRDTTLSRRAMLAAAAGSTAAIGLAQPPLARAGRPRRSVHPWTLPAHDLAASRASRVAVGSVSERWRSHLAGGITGAPVIAGQTVWAASFGGDVAAFADRISGRRHLASYRSVLRPTARTGSSASSAGSLSAAAALWSPPTASAAWTPARARRSGRPRRCAEPPGDDYFWAPPVIVEGIVLLGSGAGSEATRRAAA